MSTEKRISKLESEEAGHQVHVLLQGREETRAAFALRIAEAEDRAGPTDVMVTMHLGRRDGRN